MELIKKADRSESKYKVIVGNKEQFPKDISEKEGELFNQFLDKNEDSFFVSDLNSQLFLVKFNDNAEKMRVVGSKIRVALNKKAESIAVFGNTNLQIDLLEGFILGSYQFLKYFKDADDKQFKLKNIELSNEFSDDQCNELTSISKAVFWSRDMVNEPLSYLTAERLGEEIKQLSVTTDLNVTVLEKTQIESLKMGGLLAVNKGSLDPPTFTIVEYKGKGATNSKPIVLVGKGVVYDTGGLSLKPTANSMDIMKCDMGGAACVAGAIYLAAMQQLPLHIIALIPATDNRPGLNAYVPGDVVTMFDGTTVEVLNTDAEGRMILADALAYSKKFDPELVIDAATLTGAAHRAIGTHASIVMGNANQRYFEQLELAGTKSHERVVQFPFWDEYYEEVKSPIADLKNIGGPSAGMITAGKFLEHFVKAPYIHMDIAGPAWLDANDSYRTKGGSGYGVRLLYQFLKNFK